MDRDLPRFRCMPGHELIVMTTLSHYSSNLGIHSRDVNELLVPASSFACSDVSKLVTPYPEWDEKYFPPGSSNRTR